MKKRLLLILVAAIVGATASAIAAGRNGSTTAGHVHGNCATLAVPVNSDYNLAYDAATRELNVEYVDANGKAQAALIDVDAPACRANKGIAVAIQHALDAQAEVTAGECASFREFLASGATTAKGVDVNVGAARAYVARFCR